jgi:hypothetical protein
LVVVVVVMEEEEEEKKRGYIPVRPRTHILDGSG